MARVRRAVLLVALTGFVGCQRGCLMSWLAAHGFGATDPAEQIAAGTLAVPCPGGIVRCNDGVLRMSQSYTPPQACSPEGCRCPWDEIGRCASGCVADAIEVEMPRDVALRQLCALGPDASVATPTPPNYKRPEVDGGDAVQLDCEIERYRCVAGVVSSCDGGERPLAICSGGCAEGEGAVYEDVSPASAIAILCAHP